MSGTKDVVGQERQVRYLNKCCESHPFINEFISTVEDDDGICYEHPQNLPVLNRNGSVSITLEQESVKRIHGDDLTNVCWHKTGRTYSVVLDGMQKRCKITVLYTTHNCHGKRLYTGGDFDDNLNIAGVEHSEVECIDDAVNVAFEMPDNHDCFVAKDGISRWQMITV
ncbi:hypothetical protein ACET3Z_031974 [Daucus carota]